MSYSLEDFFEEQVVPELERVLEEFKKGDFSKSVIDEFFNVLRGAIQRSNRGDDFAGRLLDVAVDTNNEGLTPDQYLKKCFERYSEIELRKVEYTNPDGSIVSVNYRGEFEEQELQDKIADCGKE
jgi:hypothetical protein